MVGPGLLGQGLRGTAIREGAEEFGGPRGRAWQVGGLGVRTWLPYPHRGA